jgi:hypothetical protein
MEDIDSKLRVMFAQQESMLMDRFETMMMRAIASASTNQQVMSPRDAEKKETHQGNARSLDDPTSGVVQRTMAPKKYAVAEKNLKVTELTKTTDWNVWSKKFKLMMRMDDLEMFFNQDYEEAKYSTVLGVEELNRAKKVASAVLVSKADSEMMQVVREAKDQDDPVEVWKLLSSHFEGSTDFNLMNTHRELLNTTMKTSPSMTLATFIDTINKLSKRLGDYGMKVSDSEKRAILMNGIHGRYTELETLLNLAGTTMKYEEMCSHFRAYHQRKFNLTPLENPGEAAPKSGTALLVQKKPKKEMNSSEEEGSEEKQSKGDRRCFKCGETGHKISECMNETKCYSCNKGGHIAKDCMEKKERRPAVKCTYCKRLGHLRAACRQLKRDKNDGCSTCRSFRR